MASVPTNGQTNITNDWSDHIKPLISPKRVLSLCLTTSAELAEFPVHPNGTERNHKKINSRFPVKKIIQINTTSVEVLAI